MGRLFKICTPLVCCVIKIFLKTVGLLYGRLFKICSLNAPIVDGYISEVSFGVASWWPINPMSLLWLGVRE